MGRITRYKRDQFNSSVDLGAINREVSVANSFSRAMAVGAEIAEKHQKAKDLAFVNEHSMKLERNLRQKIDVWQKNNEQDPMGKQPQLEEMLNSEVDSYLQIDASSDAKESLRRMSQKMIGSSMIGADEWAKNQNIKNVGASIERTAEGLYLDAYNNRDFDSLSDLSKKKDSTVFSGSLTLSKESLDNFNQTMSKGLVVNTFEGVIEDNRLTEAQAKLDSGEFDESLGAEAKKKIQNMINRQKSLNENKEKKLKSLKKKNSYDYLLAIGETGGFEQIDFLNSTDKSFQKRQSYIEAMNEKHDLDLPLFTNEEEDNLINKMLAKADENQKLGIMQKLNNSLLPEQFNSFSEQIYKKEPALGIALSLSGDDEATTKRIIRGQEIIKNKTMPVDSEKNLLTEFQAEMGNAIGDQDFVRNVFEAVKADWVTKKYQKNEPADVIDDDFKESMKSILGPVLEVNGKKTLSFKGRDNKYVDQDDFEDILDNFDNAFFEKHKIGLPTLATGEKVSSIEDILERATFEPIGEGVYRVLVPGYGGQQFLLDESGRPWDLDIKTISKKIGKKPLNIQLSSL